MNQETGETTGEKVFFEDVCATFGPDDEYCDFWNPMAAFNYNQTVLDQVGAAGLVLPYVDALKTIMPLEAILGDVQYDPDTGIIASAAAMLVSWRLDPSRAKTQDSALVCVMRARARALTRSSESQSDRTEPCRHSSGPFCNIATRATGERRLSDRGEHC